jgi:hypothetical protein
MIEKFIKTIEVVPKEVEMFRVEMTQEQLNLVSWLVANIGGRNPDVRTPANTLHDELSRHITKIPEIPYLRIWCDKGPNPYGQSS